MAARRRLKENGLSLALSGLFMACLFGQACAGYLAHEEELREHGRPSMTISSYLASGHFMEAVFENWESEFLQMGLFVLLTVWLFQKGSSESKKLEGGNESERQPRRDRSAPNAPWPVRRGGWVLTLYEHSLSVALLLLFVLSFVLHAVFGLLKQNEERSFAGFPPERLGEYVSSSAFWYESFQNWQSEFLAVLAIVVLSIFLREYGSAQSKPVGASHEETE